ncbi:hypothetical protein G7Y79_00023g054030 [Physcia stellaris]|nr:hypothetical protein G7Y79_00023g054030 [Physcia stellaris]
MSETEEQFSKGSPVIAGAEKKDDESKSGTAQNFLGLPLEFSSRHSTETFPDISTFSADHDSRLPSGEPARGYSSSPAPAKTWRIRWATFWVRNKGLVLVVISQAFGALMSLTTRLLETEGSHGSSMHPFQILSVRMFVTLLFSLMYLYWAKIPHAPFGNREVRGLLVARGMGGFFGVFGFFYSLQYLPIAEATVITFLAPTVACFACWILINEPFTRAQQIAGLVSLLGVILIARPASLFPGSSDTAPNVGGIDGSIALTNSTNPSNSYDSNEPTLSQRFSAIALALVGVCGAACAYTTLRWIGKRAHPLISMTYFAGWCLIVSVVAIVTVPSVGFRLPSNLEEWGYLVLLGLSGFVMQFFLTAGLAHEKSSRATNMVYTQILFALAFDKMIFNTTPAGWSLVGSSLVLGSALYITVHKDKENRRSTSVREGGDAEELGLMVDHDERNEDEPHDFEPRPER